jgi:hypothetical protein
VARPRTTEQLLAMPPLIDADQPIVPFLRNLTTLPVLPLPWQSPAGGRSGAVDAAADEERLPEGSVATAKITSSHRLILLFSVLPVHLSALPLQRLRPPA